MKSCFYGICPKYAETGTEIQYFASNCQPQELRNKFNLCILYQSFSIHMQIAICPSESQFLASQSTCQTIQTHKTSNSETNSQRLWKQMIPSFSPSSLSPQVEILLSSLWTKLSLLVAAFMYIGLHLFWLKLGAWGSAYFNLVVLAKPANVVWLHLYLGAKTTEDHVKLTKRWWMASETAHVLLCSAQQCWISCQWVDVKGFCLCIL